MKCGGDAMEPVDGYLKISVKLKMRENRVRLDGLCTKAFLQETFFRVNICNCFMNQSKS